MAGTQLAQAASRPYLPSRRRRLSAAVEFDFIDYASAGLPPPTYLRTLLNIGIHIASRSIPQQAAPLRYFPLLARRPYEQVMTEITVPIHA